MFQEKTNIDHHARTRRDELAKLSKARIRPRRRTSDIQQNYKFMNVAAKTHSKESEIA
jgi:hypothetical protein